MAADEIEKTCPECGKTFGVLYPDLWRYKRTKSPGGMQFYCRWKCYRAEEKREEDMGKLTQEQKNEVVEIAIQGKDPIEYLKKCGLNNPWASWDWIKKQLIKNDPQKYLDLEREMKRKRLEKNDEKTQEDQRPPQAPLAPKHLELQGGVNYQLKVDEAKKPESIFTITAVDTELGSFSLVEGTDVIMWDAEPQDYVKMTREGWEKLAEIIPKLLRTLGSCG